MINIPSINPREWKNSEKSVGKECRFMKKRIGRLKIYQAIGPAGDAWIHLEPCVLKILADHKEEIERGVTQSTGFAVQLYMAGSHPAKTQPTILVSSVNRLERKAIKALIKSLDELAMYPGIQVECVPEVPAVLAADSQCELLDKLPRNTDCDIAIQGSPESLCGASILCGNSLATLGGVIYLDDGEKVTPFGLTVFHAGSGVETIENIFHDDDMEEFAFDESSGEEDEVEEDLFELPSRGSISSIEPSEGADEPIPSKNDEEKHGSLPKSPAGRASSAIVNENLPTLGSKNGCGFPTGPPSGLDYQVIPLPDDLYSLPNEVEIPSYHTFTLCPKYVAKEAKEANIWTVTATTGPVRGRLSLYPYLLQLPGFPLQKLWVMDLQRNIMLGDCGAWVVDQMGVLYGHIVAAVPGSNRAYILPMHRVFEHLEASTGCTPSLTNRIDLQEDTMSENNCFPSAKSPALAFEIPSPHKSQQIGHVEDSSDSDSDDGGAPCSTSPPKRSFTNYGTKMWPSTRSETETIPVKQQPAKKVTNFRNVVVESDCDVLPVVVESNDYDTISIISSTTDSTLDLVFDDNPKVIRHVIDSSQPFSVATTVSSRPAFVEDAEDEDDNRAKKADVAQTQTPYPKLSAIRKSHPPRPAYVENVKVDRETRIRLGSRFSKRPSRFSEVTTVIAHPTFLEDFEDDEKKDMPPLAASRDKRGRLFDERETKTRTGSSSHRRDYFGHNFRSSRQGPSEPLTYAPNPFGSRSQRPPLSTSPTFPSYPAHVPPSPRTSSEHSQQPLYPNSWEPKNEVPAMPYYNTPPWTQNSQAYTPTPTYYPYIAYYPVYPPNMPNFPPQAQGFYQGTGYSTQGGLAYAGATTPMPQDLAPPLPNYIPPGDWPFPIPPPPTREPSSTQPQNSFRDERKPDERFGRLINEIHEFQAWYENKDKPREQMTGSKAQWTISAVKTIANDPNEKQTYLHELIGRQKSDGDVGDDPVGQDMWSINNAEKKRAFASEMDN